MLIGNFKIFLNGVMITQIFLYSYQTIHKTSRYFIPNKFIKIIHTIIFKIRTLIKENYISPS